MARPMIPIEQKIEEGKFNKTQAKKPSMNRTSWPAVPTHYNEPHRSVFLQVCDTLDRLNNLDTSDSFIIEMFVNSWVQYQRYMAIIEKETPEYQAVSNGITMYRLRPMYVALQGEQKTIVKLMSKLGLSPADRIQLSMVFDDTKEPDAEVVEGQMVNEYTADKLDMYS